MEETKNVCYCELERACAVPMPARIPLSIQLTLHYLVQSAAEKTPSPLSPIPMPASEHPPLFHM